jgi:hypothetical protein
VGTEIVESKSYARKLKQQTQIWMLLLREYNSIIIEVEHFVLMAEEEAESGFRRVGG